MSEDTANWPHFFQYLKQVPPDTFTLMSDRDKGLIHASAEVYPNFPHLTCCKHVARNVNKKFGAAYKKYVWILARSPSLVHYNGTLKGLQEDTKLTQGKEAATYLDNLKNSLADPFIQGCRFGHYTSNISEGFNKQQVLPSLPKSASNRTLRRGWRKKTTLTEAVLTEARMLPIRSITDLRTGALAEKMATKTMWKDVLHPRRTNDTLPQSFLTLKKTA
ncbi:hypothetical protein DIPPA_03291 [Diplonema papillatum]|nr:hypothetical protein DIPPA_03291 [Diplonema papillatum]